MKKLMTVLMLIAGLCVFSAVTPAYAYVNGWQLDFSSFGLGNHVNVDRLIASGSSTVNQNFGADGIFNNGDAFQETTLISSLTYYVEPGANEDYSILDLTNDNNVTYKLFLYGSNLSGSVYNVSGTDPSTWKFDYVFNPGQELYLYLGTSLNPLTATKLATLTTILPSGGQGPAGFLGGNGPNGTTDLTTLFTYAMPGVFKWNGIDFGNLPLGYDAFGFANTHNTVTGYVPTDTGFVAQAQSNGEFNVGVVTPEPATMLLFGMGVAGLATRLRNRKKIVA